MGYRIVERPPGEATDVEIAGVTYPLPCLVEDDNGSRIALFIDVITLHDWQWAMSAGAVAYALADDFAYILADTYAEHREDNWAVQQYHWYPYTPGMSVLEMHQEIKRWPDRSAPPAEVRGNFVHLHTHSEFSSLDGLSRMEEIATAVARDGNRAVAITDHGTCAGHPALQAACDAAGIKPIFGLEAYFVDDRTERERGYHHLCLWAMDDDGLRNLWALSTESFVSGMYYKPRVDWELLERYNEGLLVSTACLSGPLAKPFLEGDTDHALENLLKLKRIFGDRLYIELHANGLEDQRKVNRWSVDVAAAHDVPLLAVVDSHYAEAAHKDDHRVWLSIQTNSDVSDDSALFGGDNDYHLLTRDEVAQSLWYLDLDVVNEAIENTVIAADRCSARMVGKDHNPIFSKWSAEHPDREEHDVERLFDLIAEHWDERTKGKREPQEVYLARLEEEMGIIVPKRFPGYFLIVAEIVRYAKENRVLVGPGRGSAGGSLVAYVIGITEVDPVDHNLLFARFMTPGRMEPPDIDLDFPSTRKQFMLDFVTRRWGAEHVATVGTHLRLKSKGVVRDVARAIKSTLPDDYWRDVDAVSAIITEAEAGTAGLGLAWDALWDEHGEVLEPFREKYPELFSYCDSLHGRLKTYGAHPAGVIIDPDNRVTDALPLRLGDGGQVVSQFDMVAVTMLGQLKVDLLNLRTLDTLQQCLDLIFERTGRWIDVYSWDEELRDPQIYEALSEGWTLGVFQVETQVGTTMCKRLKPDSVAAMADVITLVRPGPMRSGLTETYLRRRAGEEEVFLVDERMAEALAATYGAIIYQEQIMATVMTLAGYDATEADEVRKILGKKKVDKVLAAGEKFIAAAVARGMDRSAAVALWDQMAEFAKYSFGGAHAVAYAKLGVWTAWFKFHYPVEFLTACLSTVKAERIPEFVEEARRMGYRVLPPDINESGEGFTAGLDYVRYGLDSVKGVGPAAVAAILEGRADFPFVDWDDFLERKGSKCNSGHVKTLVKIGAFDSLVPNRRGLEEKLALEAVISTGTDSCLWKGENERRVTWLPRPLTREQREELALIQEATAEESSAANEWWSNVTERTEHRLPCDYPWVSEPDVLGRTGKPTKRKAPPKKCTRACRQFTPAELPDTEQTTPYTDAEIRSIEMDILGVYLSSTPFDDIPEELLDELVTGNDVRTGGNGTYLVAAVVREFRRIFDSSGRAMGFLTVDTPQGSLEAVVFSRVYELYSEHIIDRALLVLAVTKDDRGCKLLQLEPLNEEVPV